MSDAELQKLIRDYASGMISPQQHQVLKDTLKSNSNARAVFREWMDLEASLRTWASEDAATPLQGPHESVRGERQHTERLLRGRPFLPMLFAASIALFAVAGWLWRQHRDSSVELAKEPQNTTVTPLVYLGTAAQQKGCVWSSASLLPGSRFPEGKREGGRF